MKTAFFNRFTLDLPDTAVTDMSQPGPVDTAVSFWADALPNADISPDDIRDELKEYGAWDEAELSDDAENWQRILWIAACDINEREAVADALKIDYFHVDFDGVTYCIRS